MDMEALKQQARMAVRIALRNGTMVRPTRCSFCSLEAKVEAHHDNYDDRIAVKWLCRRCHRLLHSLKLVPEPTTPYVPHPRKGVYRELRNKLKDNGITIPNLAQTLGITEDYLHRILSRRQTPGAHLALRIEAATKRAIRWSDLYPKEMATPDRVA